MDVTVLKIFKDSKRRNCKKKRTTGTSVEKKYTEGPTRRPINFKV